MGNPPASTTAQELEEANRIAPTDAAKAEELYRGILSRQTSTLNSHMSFLMLPQSLRQLDTNEWTDADQ
jgi:hypothetical protein